MRWRDAVRCAVALAVPQLVAGQGRAIAPLVRPEWVLAVQASPQAGAAVGIGADLALESQLRLAVTASAGAIADGTTRRTGRVDLVTRFLLDPYAQLRWGLSGGAGLTTHWDDGAPHSALLLAGGIEGPASHGWRPAVEAALGHGVRLTVSLRRARSRGR